jgi:hypothetical protein
MSTTKRISGTYTIQTLNPTDQINIDSPLVVVNGNLWVTGNSQVVSTTDTAISNNTITLNNGATTPNPLGANIIVDRGSSANVSVRWNETVQQWQFTNDGVTYGNIVSSGSAIANLFADSAPRVSANLNLYSHTIFDSTTTANVQLFLSNTVATGGTGVYVTNTRYSNVELINRTRSIAYSILFG